MKTKTWHRQHRATRVAFNCQDDGAIYLSFSFNGMVPWEYIGTQGQKDAKSFAKYLRTMADYIEQPPTTGGKHE